MLYKIPSGTTTAHKTSGLQCVINAALTFRDGVEVGFLAHGSQQRQGADVDPHFGVAVIFPGVILDHVEQTTDQVEHAMLWMILQAQTCCKKPVKAEECVRFDLKVTPELLTQLYKQRN